MIPPQSILYLPAPSRLFSGSSLVRYSAIIATITAKKKIHLQPKLEAIIPPVSELNPEPPNVPIDQRLIARWRFAFPEDFNHT